MKLSIKHLDLLIHYQDNHVARLAQLSAAKQKLFLELAAYGFMIEELIQDSLDPMVYTDVKYIHITSKGHAMLDHLVQEANKYETI